MVGEQVFIKSFCISFWGHCSAGEVLASAKKEKEGEREKETGWREGERREGEKIEKAPTIQLWEGRGR